MSAAHRPKGRRIFTARVPTERGEWLGRTTGTRDPIQAKRIQEMIGALGPLGRRTWDLLELVTGAPNKPPRFSLAELYRRWSETPARHTRTGKPLEPSIDERVEYVRASLIEGDLRKLLKQFHEIMKKPASGISVDTADHYRYAVRDFFAHVLALEEDDGTSFVPIVKLSEREIRTWIEEMDDVEPGTVRKRAIGLHRFIRWLRGRSLVLSDPMLEIPLPPPGPPRVHFLETPEAKKLADAHVGQYRHYAALLPGSGIEVSVALRLRARDVSRDDKEIRAAGTKTHSRDRIVRVAEWAWPAVLEIAKGKHPDSLLFNEIPHRWAAGDAHTEAVKALAESMPILLEHGGYTMRDHRHTYAVRAARAGVPAELIARQLGHKDAVLVHRVYGRFFPSQRERDYWEKIATAQEKARAKRDAERAKEEQK